MVMKDHGCQHVHKIYELINQWVINKNRKFNLWLMRSIHLHMLLMQRTEIFAIHQKTFAKH